VPWLEPSLSLRWGPYAKLDGDEQSKIVTATIAAKDAGICTTRQAVEKVAPVFGTENVDAVLAALEKEADERAKKMLDQQMTLEHSMAKLANGSEAPPGGEKGKDANPSGGDAAASGAA
jgi:hypothetical protein